MKKKRQVILNVCFIILNDVSKNKCRRRTHVSPHTHPWMSSRKVFLFNLHFNKLSSLITAIYYDDEDNEESFHLNSHLYKIAFFFLPLIRTKQTSSFILLLFFLRFQHFLLLLVSVCHRAFKYFKVLCYIAQMWYLICLSSSSYLKSFCILITTFKHLLVYFFCFVIILNTKKKLFHSFRLQVMDRQLSRRSTSCMAWRLNVKN